MGIKRMTTNIKGRFAPSPTGRMHLGNVYAALMSWLSAKSRGGQWLLRIEDIDRQRSHQEYADQLMRDLEWLGLTWDEGPYYQSQRSEVYAEALAILQSKGLTYPCYCTRADIMATQAPHESDGRVVYSGRCRNRRDVPVGPAATRIIVPDTEVCYFDGNYGEQTLNLAHHCGDFILRRKDGAWAYQLAVVVDDALMGVNEVVRGCDLLQSVPQQLYLFNMLYPEKETPQYYHIPLLCNTSGQRLSKRDASLDLGFLSARYTSGEVLGIIARCSGMLPDDVGVKYSGRFSVTANELLERFSWDKVPTQNITMDVSENESF